MAKFWSSRRIDLPETGTIGDIYFCSDTRELFIAIGTGGMVPMAGLLAGPAFGQVGPIGHQGDRGPQGEPGDSIPGSVIRKLRALTDNLVVDVFGVLHIRVDGGTF